MKSPYYGTFVNEVRTVWLSDHPRNMRLLDDVKFIDNRGRTVWTAGKGTVINGASTGWFLRRLFPAFIGKYRRATVVHDYYCMNRKDIPSWKVHRMFRDAMLADGTSVAVAWIMWIGVRLFGPRFGPRC